MRPFPSGAVSARTSSGRGVPDRNPSRCGAQHLPRCGTKGIALPNREPFGVNLYSQITLAKPERRCYSTVTLLARLRGWSTSVPLSMAT
jgi:hypothetical protein